MGAIDPVEVSLRLHEQAEASLPNPAPFMDQAREELIERLIAGKKVNGVYERDIFDSALDKSYHSVLDILVNVLALSEKCGDDFLLDAGDCANAAKKVIEAFVDSKPEWILERAGEIASDDYEESRE